MSQNSQNLIWIDMEMTGLRPDVDRIIEVGVVVTDSELNPLDEGMVWVVHQSEDVLKGMDEWNTSTHSRSGLVQKVKDSTLNESQVESNVIQYLSQYVEVNTSPMCGNSICQDRRFMAKWMPALEAFFHYRNLDVSTLKELAKRWSPDILKGLEKHGKHEALADVMESIAELKYYREHLLLVRP